MGIRPGIRLRHLLVGVLTVGAVVIGTAAAAPAATRSDRSADQQLAKAGVLQRGDFPDGWGQAKRDNSSDASVQQAAAKIPGCAQFVKFSKTNKQNPRAESPEFTLGQSSVDNTANVFPSTKAATAAMTIFGSSALPGCLDKLFTSVFNAQFAADPKTAEQITGLGVKINRLRGINIGDKAVAYEGVVDVNLTDGSTETIGLGYIAIQVGRAVSGFTYSSDSDISAALQPAIVSSVARLKKAVGTTS